MSATRILVVDDELQIRRVLRATLTAQGYEVATASNGTEALSHLQSKPTDLVLLDMNLPGLDGLATCRTMREHHDVPILIVSIRNSERDKVQALDAGADDYVTKPFGMNELLARIRAALRRVPPNEVGEHPSVLQLGDLIVDFAARRVNGPAGSIRLTPKEFELLRCLVSNAGTVVPHRKLLHTVWGPDYDEEVEYLRVFINQLRKKIERDPSHPRYILTEPWIGYRFVCETAASA